MWERLSKMATGLVSLDPDALQAENLELKHELNALTEDYELLKEAHKKALEQLSPQQSHTSRDLYCLLPTQEYGILKESNAKLSKQLSTLSAVVKIESAQLYQSLSNERLELAKIREELNSRESQLRDREVTLQTAQMLQSTDTDLTSILQQNIKLNDSLQSLKTENDSLKLELNEVKVGYIQNSKEKSSSKDRDLIPVRYNQIILKLQQQLIQVRAVQKDQSLRLMVEEAEGYFMNQMKNFEKKWYDLVYRMGTLQKDLKETKDRNIKVKKESEKEMNDMIRKYEQQIKELQLENEKLKNLLVEKENQLIAVKKNEYYTEPVVKNHKPKVEKEEKFFDIESLPKESPKPSFTPLPPSQSSQELPKSSSMSLTPAHPPRESLKPSLSTSIPALHQELPKPSPAEELKESSIIESHPVVSSLLDYIKDSTPLSKESPSEEVKLSSSLDSEKLGAPRQPLLQKKVPRIGARGINLRSSKPAGDDIDLEEILGSSAPSIDQLKKTLGNFKS